MERSAKSSEKEIDWDNVKIPKYAAVDVRYSLNKKNVTDLLNCVWNGGHRDLSGNCRQQMCDVTCCPHSLLLALNDTASNPGMPISDDTPCKSDSLPKMSRRCSSSITLTSLISVVGIHGSYPKLHICRVGLSISCKLGVKIWREPFRCCEVTDFLFDDDFVEDLAKNFEEIELNEKRTDLYKFKQSEDLSSIDDPEAETLVKCLKGQCRQWIEEVTGFELTQKVHATFSSYSRSDYLHCHDDRGEDRKIAYILYCNKIWEETDGGALEFYDTDERGQPRNVVKSILPAYNKFVFFEVSAKSFHRVAEVISRQRDRISVNGWFHSGYIPPPPTDYCKFPDLMSYLLSIDMSGKEFSSLIQKRYLREEVQVDIKKHFEEESEVMLFEFLYAKLINAVTKDLRSAVEWKEVGPTNHREMPQCCFDVQRWDCGNYTVMSDTDKLLTDYALDVILFISAEVVLGERSGGSIVYVGSEDGSEKPKRMHSTVHMLSSFEDTVSQGSNLYRK